MKVHSDTTGLHRGAWIDLQAWYSKESTLTARTRALAKNLKYKIGLSLLPPVLMAALWFSTFICKGEGH